MKQLLCLLSLVVILSSCSKSPEQKAKDLIKEEMKKSMNDFSSYEPVEYGKLDSTFNVPSHELKGWNMVHKFRGKNKFGAIVLSSVIFDFDKDLTKVVDETNVEN